MYQDIILSDTLPKSIIDIEIIPKLCVNGRGGRESEISNIFKNTTIVNRINNGIYDFEIEYEEKKYYVEIKKQEKHQWFDIGKYHNISQEHEKIIILFVMHKKGEIQLIAAISLIDFLNICNKDLETRALGWTEEVIKMASEIKLKYPTLQFKVKAYINKLIIRHKEAFNILYENDEVSC